MSISANATKHGISFTEASTIFEDAFSHTIVDPLHSDDENRFVIPGTSSLQRLLVAVHTYREDTIRIINARTVTSRERRNYEQGNE